MIPLKAVTKYGEIMIRYFKPLFLACVFWAGLVVFCAPAFAKLPDAVLEPYRAYNAAVESGDMKTASAQAQKAWEQAEALLGDHKTTGDLAQLFADVKDQSTFKKRARAYERAVELASFHGDDAQALAVERQIKFIQMYLFDSGKYRINSNNVRRAGVQVKKAKGMIESYGFTGMMFDGEVQTLNAMILSMNGLEKKALETFESAIETFDNVEQKLPSSMPYLAKLYRADLLKEKDENLTALLQYQEVMQNVEGLVESDHPFVRKAFTQWLFLRSEFEGDGKLEEIEAAGVCECWPYEDYKDKVIPLERVPPIMPPNAERSGRVVVKFNVTDEGKPMDMEVVSSTERLFERPALESVSKWKYSKKVGEEPENARKDIITTIIYKLANGSGRLIPERR